MTDWKWNKSNQPNRPAGLNPSDIQEPEPIDFSNASKDSVDGLPAFSNTPDVAPASTNDKPLGPLVPLPKVVKRDPTVVRPKKVRTFPNARFVNPLEQYVRYLKKRLQEHNPITVADLNELERKTAEVGSLGSSQARGNQRQV